MKNPSITYQDRFTLFKKIVVLYESIHLLGYTHGSLYPQNIYLKNNEVLLAEFGQARPFDSTVELQVTENRFSNFNAPELTYRPI